MTEQEKGEYLMTSRLPQQTRNVDPMMFYCRAIVEDDGQVLQHHWFKV